MSDNYDYQALLTRARDSIPVDIAQHTRFKVPEIDVLHEGKTTVIRNFTEIADAIQRDPEHILAFLLKELGTAGNLKGKRIVFKGKLMVKQIEERLKNYVDVYVLCSECERPDTKLLKDGRTLVLECSACGAHRPVKVRKGLRSESNRPPIEEGKVIELMIQDLGKRGDGIAKIDKYIIFVPGVSKGAMVRIRINKIDGYRAFGVAVMD